MIKELIAVAAMGTPIPSSGWFVQDSGSPASDISLVGDGEPGTPLIITGTVYQSNGTTPVPGTLLFVYQTDARGEYDRTGSLARIHGTVRTDENGRYRIRTIRPGSYPGTKILAHIHARITAPKGKEQWIKDFLFADDPFVSRDAAKASSKDGRFANVMTVEIGDDGTQRCVRDIRLP